MPSPNATGSTLANLSQRSDQLKRIRLRLGMEGASRGVPQGNVQAAQPTNPENQPNMDVDSAIEQAFSGDRRAQMLERIRQAMPGIQATQGDTGGQMVAGAGQPPAPAPTVTNPLETLQPETRPLKERLQDQGAISVSPLEQFARLAGRMPSPRELAVFQARLTLEGQLGRVPTATELKMYLMRPEQEDGSFPRAFEGP